MQRSMTLPSEVTQRVCEYLDLLDRERARFVQGVYLVGSVALGDYQEGRSDIDFVALAAAPLSGPQLESLMRIHTTMAAAGGPPFDGFYIEQNELIRRPTLGMRVPFSLHGLFHTEAACSASSTMARFSSRDQDRRVPATTVWVFDPGPDIGPIRRSQAPPVSRPNPHPHKAPAPERLRWMLRRG